MSLKSKFLAERLFASYWFIPSVILLGAIFLSWLTLTLDSFFDLEQTQNPWFRFIVFNQADGARSVLSTIASSMISVAGVTFSITMVVLSLASSQFGPRLLRNFMRDRANQVVLGVFLATFLYCLLILRTIQEGDYRFVPHMSLTIALVLAVLSVAVFIYFIHHTAESIRVSTVIERVSQELTARIEELYQGPGFAYLRQQVNKASLPDDFDEQHQVLEGQHEGYLQGFDHKALCQLASKHKLILELPYRVGDFIAREAPLIRVYAHDDVVEDDLEQALCAALLIGMHREEPSEVSLLLDQYVEMALRALSPGVNDPFTALACLDRIAGALLMLVQKGTPQVIYYDDEGEARLFGQAISMVEMVHRTLSVIRPFATDNLLVYEKLFKTLTLLEKRGSAQLDEVLAQERELLLEKAHTDFAPKDVERLARY